MVSTFLYGNYFTILILFYRPWSNLFLFKNRYSAAHHQLHTSTIQHAAHHHGTGDGVGVVDVVQTGTAVRHNFKRHRIYMSD